VFGKVHRKGCVRKGTKEGMCSQRDNGRNVFGKGHKKGCVPFLMRAGTCKGTQGKVFANMSAGIDTKANTLELVRVPSSLLQRLQCGVALESLCDRGCSFGTEPVVLKTAAGGVRRWGGEPCQRALTQKQTGGVSMGVDTESEHSGAAAHSRLEICVSLRMAASAAAPLTPILFSARLRARGGVGMVREQVCQWALTQKRTLGRRRTSGW